MCVCVCVCVRACACACVCECECEWAFLIAQMVEHGASNAKIMGSIPRESKS